MTKLKVHKYEYRIKSKLPKYLNDVLIPEGDTLQGIPYRDTPRSGIGLLLSDGHLERSERSEDQPFFIKRVYLHLQVELD